MTKLSPMAIVLAAGLGLRMRPLTLTTPKPLLHVGGKSMLDHALDRLCDIGVTRVVVNTHYLPEQMNEALDTRRDVEIIISHEPELLDTGGGVKNALHHFGDKPFLVINADLPWLDEGTPALKRMAHAWDAGRMDVLLLLQHRSKARGFGERGDFVMEPDGRVHRHDTAPPYPYCMMAAQIMKPELFANIPDKIFSNNVIWNAAEEKQRLYGIEHLGSSYHVGTPSDWEEANRLLTTGQGWG